MQPTASALTHKVAKFIASNSNLLASSPEAIIFASSIDTLSKIYSAHVCSSIVLKELNETPLASWSTRTNAKELSLIQDTIILEAFLPFKTSDFVPLSLLLSDKFVFGFKYSYEFLGSANAKDTCIEPEHIPPINSNFLSKFDLSRTVPAKTILAK